MSRAELGVRPVKQIETVLNRVPELSPYYRLVVTRERTLDDLEVQAEVTDSSHVSDDSLAEYVAGLIKSTIGCTARVTLVEPANPPLRGRPSWPASATCASSEAAV